MSKEFKAIVIGTCTGTTISRHTSIDLALRKANKNNLKNPRYPMKVIQYSKNYWEEMS